MLRKTGIGVIENRPTCNADKLEQVKQILFEISRDWNENEVIEYGASMSFDELVAEIHTIHLR